MISRSSSKNLNLKSNSLVQTFKLNTNRKKESPLRSNQPKKNNVNLQNKQNANVTNIQIKKLNNSKESFQNSPGKLNKSQFFVNKLSKSNHNKKQETPSPNNPVNIKITNVNTEISSFTSQNSKQSLHENPLDRKQAIRLKINIKDDRKSKLPQRKRKLSMAQNNINILQKFEQVNWCMNHPEKKAKYALIINNQKSYSCAKCAILSAAHGYKIKQISTQKFDRAKILENFLEKIEEICPKMKSQINTLQKYRIIANITYDSLLEKHNCYYDKIINSFTLLKQEGELFLNESKESILKELNDSEVMIKGYLENSMYMEKDILPNLNQIMAVNITKTAEDKFNLSIQKYNEKLFQYDKEMQQLKAYKPEMYRLESDYDRKLKNCIQAISYYKLEFEKDVKMPDQSYSSNSNNLLASQRDRLNKNYMYFSFEDKTKKPKENNEIIHPLNNYESSLENNFYNSNKDMVNLFPESLSEDEDRDSPRFKNV